MPTPPVPPLPTPLVIQSHSAHVTQGRAYDFVLYTHCGIDFEVDFDGSFWDWIATEQVRPDLGNPLQRGTMTLLGQDEARFDYPGGSLRFTRHQGPKTVPGLCM